jgi:hypothetical protein
MPATPPPGAAKVATSCYDGPVISLKVICRRDPDMNTMTVTQVSSATLAEEIKHKADEGAGIVEVMDQGGKRTHVVLRDDVYGRLLGPTLLEKVSHPEGGDVEFEPLRMSDNVFRPADLR